MKSECLQGKQEERGYYNRKGRLPEGASDCSAWTSGLGPQLPVLCNNPLSPSQPSVCDPIENVSPVPTSCTLAQTHESFVFPLGHMRKGCFYVGEETKGSYEEMQTKEESSVLP